MKKLILILPFFLSGCLYIKRDIGLTTYSYDKCKEYYDANGEYHKDCYDTEGRVLQENIAHTKRSIEKNTKCIIKKTKELFGYDKK